MDKKQEAISTAVQSTTAASIPAVHTELRTTTRRYAIAEERFVDVALNRGLTNNDSSKSSCVAGKA